MTLTDLVFYNILIHSFWFKVIENFSRYRFTIIKMKIYSQYHSNSESKQNKSLLKNLPIKVYSFLFLFFSGVCKFSAVDYYLC